MVVEFFGGNDGLNIVVLFGDDEYYWVWLNLGILEVSIFLIVDGFGFYLVMVGFEWFYKDGMMVVVYGCGYDNLSLFYFFLMGFWYMGVFNGGELLGWLGCFVDGVYDYDV